MDLFYSAHISFYNGFVSDKPSLCRFGCFTPTRNKVAISARTSVAKAAQPSSTSGDAESQRQVMNARCAALLEAQRAAFRRRVELRKEAILAATAKAKAAGTLPTHEVSAAAGDRDDPMRSSTGAELPANDVQNATDSHPGPSSLPRAYTKCALLLWPCIQFHSILYVYYSLIFAVPSQVTPMADMKRENSFMARHLIHFSVRDHSDVLVHQAVAYLRHAGVFINRSLFLTTTGLCLYWRSFCSISRDWTRIFLLHLYSLASLFNCFFEQRTTPSTSEPSGPKSRADPPSGFIFRRRFSFSFAGWICITLFLSSFTRVGGVRVASDATEAGSQELLATATSGGRLLSTAKKRAFHRAQAEGASCWWHFLQRQMVYGQIFTCQRSGCIGRCPSPATWHFSYLAAKPEGP